MAKQWRDQWVVPSSDGSKSYTVSLDFEGEYACACPRWIFRREECRHIQDVQDGRYPSVREVPLPVPVFHVAEVQRAMISQRDGNGRVIEVLVPPIAPVNDGLLLTVLYDLADMGFSWTFVKARYRQRIDEYRKRNGLRRALSHNAVKSYVKAHGRVFYIPSGVTPTVDWRQQAAAPELRVYVPEAVSREEPAPYKGVVANETVRVVAW